jgi:hypothetical protein
MTRRALALAFCLPAALCAGWTIFAGKDLSWDLLNYHYYGPFQLLEGRLRQDFFAASAQSYLNPIGYLPFYAMVAAGWHSVAVSIVLALAHSLSVAALYLIAWRLFAHLPSRERLVFSALATALGAASAVFWTTVGTSSIDPLLAVPMLFGLVVLIDGRQFALAGALFGAAAALKYSNAIFALAAFPLTLYTRPRLRPALAYIAGGALAVAVLAGPWLVLMLREFGNPVFPLMNAWFQSPDAPAINLIATRFTPRDLLDGLVFPFRMVVLDRSLYSEIFAPDVRLAALVVVAFAVPVFARTSESAALRGADWRVFAFFAPAALLWLGTSANGRYGMLVLLLGGVCLARLAARLFAPGAARVVLGLLLAVQLVTAATAAAPRWFLAEPWSRQWIAYEAPPRAQQQPALYLTLETLPMAVVAPFVHSASSFVNFRGQHSIASDAPRLAALLEQHRGRVRVLGRNLELTGGRPQEDQIRAYDAALLRIGLKLDPADCFAIAWRPDAGDGVSRAANRFLGPLPAPESLALSSCGLRAAQRDPADVERERAVSALFDRIERHCPKLFRGQTAVTDRLGNGWSRNYAGLDARLEIMGDLLVLNRYRAGQLVRLGQRSDWERGAAPPCDNP